MKHIYFLTLIIFSLLLGTVDLIADKHKVKEEFQIAGTTLKKNPKIKTSDKEVKLNVKQPGGKGTPITIGSKKHHASLSSDKFWPANLSNVDFAYDVNLVRGKFTVGLWGEYADGHRGWITSTTLTERGVNRGKLHVGRNIAKWAKIVFTNQGNKEWCNLEVNSFRVINSFTEKPVTLIKIADQGKYAWGPGGELVLKPRVVYKESTPWPPQSSDHGGGTGPGNGSGSGYDNPSR